MEEDKTCIAIIMDIFTLIATNIPTLQSTIDIRMGSTYVCNKM